MSRTIILLAALVFFISCAPSMEKLLQVKMGMDRAEVVEILGKPSGFELSGSNWKSLYYGPYWFLFDHDDKLQLIDIPYGRSSNSFSGVVTVVR